MAEKKSVYIIKLALTGAILAVLTAMFTVKFVSSIGTINMPDLTGMDQEKAKAACARLKIDFKVSDTVFNAIYEPGKVINQSIKPKMPIKKGRTVYVTISKGSKMVTVPDIRGSLKSKALLTLKNSDLSYGAESSVKSQVYAENIIISQWPAPGTEVPFDHPVNTVRSLGRGTDNFVMPDWKGASVYEIYRSLRKTGLYIDKLEVKNDLSLPSGTVISQQPEPGYIVNKDIPISLTVSKIDSDLTLKKRLIRITYSVTSPDNVPKLLKITVLSLNGSETVYNKMTSPSDKVDIMAGVRGDAYAQFFVNGILESEQEYRNGGSGE